MLKANEECWQTLTSPSKIAASRKPAARNSLTGCLVFIQDPTVTHQSEEGGAHA